MKRDVSRFALALFAIVAAGAVEELCPKPAGVGVPALLSLSCAMALRRPPLEGAMFALAAGFAEDALSALPFATSALFFLLSAALLRWRKLPIVCAIPAHCAYQIWLWTWYGGRLGGGVFARVSVALPVGAATLAAAWVLLLWLDGKAAVDG